MNATVFPKYSNAEVPVPQNMTLFGNRVMADVIN